MTDSASSSDKRFFLNTVLKEITGTVSSPVLDYMKSDILSHNADVLCALACAVNDCTSHNCANSAVDDCDSLSDEDFLRAFRFRKNTIKVHPVLDLVKHLEKRLLPYELNSTKISLEKKVLLSIWLLTSGGEYPAASKVFNVSEDLVLAVFIEVCSELTKLVGQFINWPSESEKPTISEVYEMQYGMSNVLGVIGCTFFDLSRPLQDKCGNSGNNPPSDHHSIVVQAVCDHQLMLRDVCVGFPSRRSPSEMLRDSPLFTRLTDRQSPLMSPKTFILGSGLYPQLANLLTPYSSEGRGPLDERELYFNKMHSAVEKDIHKCFKMLRCRFLRLKSIVSRSAPKATQMIMACCVLHNFALLRGDVFVD